MAKKSKENTMAREALSRAIDLADIWRRNDFKGATSADIMTAAVVRISRILAAIEDDETRQTLIDITHKEIGFLSRAYQVDMKLSELEEITGNQDAS